MTMHRVLLIIFISLLNVGSLAQERLDNSAADAPLPVCTGADAQIALHYLDESNVVNDLEATLINISEEIANFYIGYSDLVYIRNTYYIEVAPALPDCRAVWRFKLAFSAYLTNTTLNVGNLIIGILIGDVESLNTLTEPFNSTMAELRLQADLAYSALHLLADEDIGSGEKG